MATAPLTSGKLLDAYNATSEEGRAEFLAAKGLISFAELNADAIVELLESDPALKAAVQEKIGTKPVTVEETKAVTETKTRIPLRERRILGRKIIG